MRILIYESGLGNNTVCIYETNTKNVKKYAIEAYHGKHADDIAWDWDGEQYYEVDFKNKIICLDVGDAIHFDLAIDADEIDNWEEGND